MDKLSHKSTFDFSIFFTAVALWVAGIALIYSATHIHETGPLAHVARNQIIWVGMGITILLLIVSIPSRFLFGFAYVFYALSCMLLIAAIFTGITSKGSERWIAVAGFRVQPSEFAKIGLLFALARYLSQKTVSLGRLTSFVVPGILILIPFALVLKQPDLGTALVFGAMALPMFFWAGLTLLEVFYLVSPALSLVLSLIPLIVAYGSETAPGFVGAIPWGVFFIVLCVILYLTRPPFLILVGTIIANLTTATITTVLWNSFLKDYQKSRIISFINPQLDPFGAGYQVIQSKVAVGSGALFGKGFLQGTQSRLSFLPEQHTDFIFSVLGEQFGLFGSALVISLFLFLIIRSYLSTHMIRNRFSNLIIVGAASILAFHVYVNIAMTIGMMPVTGLPLPFLSYGGSFAITVSILIGLILNARHSGEDF